MKATRVASMMCLLTCVFLLGGCGGAKYDDVEKASEEYAKAIESYVADLDKAGSAGDAAKAIDRFSGAMEQLAPTMKKLAEKYPELKDGKELPEALKDVQKRTEEAGKKMMGAMMKIGPYMTDPAVQEAQQRMQAAMMKMQ